MIHCVRLIKSYPAGAGCIAIIGAHVLFVAAYLIATIITN